ncbi:MAG TPA: hypothetical protein VGW09_00670 [Nitrososphaeraceae archaeon]|nr:hypothetical protein [Nitrososphaeraceae archaeon]
MLIAITYYAREQSKLAPRLKGIDDKSSKAVGTLNISPTSLSLILRLYIFWPQEEQNNTPGSGS